MIVEEPNSDSDEVEDNDSEDNKKKKESRNSEIEEIGGDNDDIEKTFHAFNYDASDMIIRGKHHEWKLHRSVVCPQSSALAKLLQEGGLVSTKPCHI